MTESESVALLEIVPKAKFQEAGAHHLYSFTVPVLRSSSGLEREVEVSDLSHLAETRSKHVSETKSLASEGCLAEAHAGESRPTVGGQGGRMFMRREQ